MKNRKTIFFGLILFVAMLMTSTFTFGNEKEFLPCDKVYIVKDQLFFSENSIFVNVENEWVETDAIKIDGHGLYFSSFSTHQLNIDFKWKCPKCDYRNYPWANTCKKCNYNPSKGD